jgi:hypothetical protein
MTMTASDLSSSLFLVLVAKGGEIRGVNYFLRHGVVFVMESSSLPLLQDFSSCPCPIRLRVSVLGCELRVAQNSICVIMLLL